MSELSPLSNGAVNRTGRIGPGRLSLVGSPDAPRVPGRDRGEDSVEVSATGQHLAILKEGGPVRADLVNRIRAEIEQNAYETPEKLDAAIEELLEDLED
jgi:anti-sigma28 factor (negative regulator of flagellin synthesis)